MASAHIEITGNGRLNGDLRAFVDHLQRSQELCNQLKAVFDQLALGGDWTSLAAGLNIESETDAEAIYNILGSVRTELDGTFINQILGRLG